MKMLTTASKAAIEQWQIELVKFDAKVEEHRAKYNPSYVSDLSMWVSPAAWRSISEDLLVEGRTTPGSKPNAQAVTAYLRQQGPYAPKTGQQKGKIRYSNPLRPLLSIQWACGPQITHLMAYEQYMESWSQQLSTIRNVDVPTPRDQVRIMIRAIRPGEQ